MSYNEQDIKDYIITQLFGYLPGPHIFYNQTITMVYTYDRLRLPIYKLIDEIKHKFNCTEGFCDFLTIQSLRFEFYGDYNMLRVFDIINNTKEVVDILSSISGFDSNDFENVLFPSVFNRASPFRFVINSKKILNIVLKYLDILKNKLKNLTKPSQFDQKMWDKTIKEITLRL